MLALIAACQATPVDTGEPEPLVAVTWNTGTSGPTYQGAPFDDASAEAADAWYGNGLGWQPAVDAAQVWLGEVQPDVIALQELFWSGACAEVPAEAREGFVCETWSAGDGAVVNDILGEAYQVACHPDRPDKCRAMRAELGTWAGCDDPLCLDGLDGALVDGCGSGARVARGVVVDADGDPVLTVVSVHGSSGLTADDQACRVAQVEQVFVELGDGSPAVSGARNLVLGDLNTDPGRWVDFDPSAARWLDFVGAGQPFAWVTDVGPDATPTYGGVANIDHVIADALAADAPCAHPAVEATLGFFDHVPAVCTVR